MALDDLAGLASHRRHWLKLGISAAAACGPWCAIRTANLCPSRPPSHGSSNGGPRPYPIPWLDKNGNHNQPAMANVELSSIYNSKELGCCNCFPSTGTDKKGNRLTWCSPTTEYCCRAGTGRHAGRNKLSSPVHDSP